MFLIAFCSAAFIFSRNSSLTKRSTISGSFCWLSSISRFGLETVMKWLGRSLSFRLLSELSGAA
ncbi:hypothetical protein D3C71_1816570 [compost metagenome]